MKYIFALLFTIAFFQLKAQNEGIIHLKNSSFEGNPRHSLSPISWKDCGFEGESPPDIQPDGTFSVRKPAYDGQTYLGMVVRDNNTWESVGQELSNPLKKGQAYSFSLMLARSELYLSSSRIKPEEVNYNTPCKLKIWAGNEFCHREQLLAESKEVVHFEWKEYSFQFIPNHHYSHIVLEVFYKTPILFPYNGNLLLDKASSIVPIEKVDTLATASITKVETTELPFYEFTYPSTSEELINLVRNNGKKIIFDNNRLHHFYYQTPEEEELWNNPHFHIIAEALAEYPEVLLIIAVKGSIHRVTSLKNALALFGVSEEKIVIRPIQPGDKDRKWLWSDLRTPLKMRLVFN